MLHSIRKKVHDTTSIKCSWDHKKMILMEAVIIITSPAKIQKQVET